MGFNIHILSGGNRSTNLPGHAALAASFNPNSQQALKEYETCRPKPLRALVSYIPLSNKTRTISWSPAESVVVFISSADHAAPEFCA
jgi:hypothetical protein